MSTLKAQTIVSTINPTEGFVSYVNDIKPYHTKVLEVFVEYIHQEDVTTSITESITMELQ